MPYQIIVCGGLAPDPLQTLEPVAGPNGPALKNEAMLPNVLDPWAGHALYEAANLAKQFPGSTIRVVSLAPKAKLQQVMMTIAQKLPFELIPIDAPGAGGFSDSVSTAAAIVGAIQKIPGLDLANLLVFGGWESATRGAGVVMQMVAEKLEITEVFLAVDELKIDETGALTIKERSEGGVHQVSKCAAPPAVLAWATGSLPEPANHPQTGMANMRAMMPALQKAPSVALDLSAVKYSHAGLPAVTRQTKLVKDVPAAEVAADIYAWIKQQ